MMVRRGVMTPPSKNPDPKNSTPPTKSNRNPPSIALLQLCEFSHLKLLFLYNFCFNEIISQKKMLMDMNQICNGLENKLNFC